MDEERPADKYRLSKSVTDIKSTIGTSGDVPLIGRSTFCPFVLLQIKTIVLKIKMLFSSLVTPRDFIKLCRVKNVTLIRPNITENLEKKNYELGYRITRKYTQF